MWMHFVSYCSQDASGFNADTDADTLQAFFHPHYVRSRHHMHVISTPPTLCVETPASTGCRKHISRRFQSQRNDVLADVDQAMNPFTNVTRLDVFRSLSRGLNADGAMKAPYLSHPIMLNSDPEGLYSTCTSPRVTPRLKPNTNLNLNLAVHTRCSPSPSPSYLSCVSLAQRKDEVYAAVELHRANSELFSSPLRVNRVSSKEGPARLHCAAASKMLSDCCRQQWMRSSYREVDVHVSGQEIRLLLDASNYGGNTPTTLREQSMPPSSLTDHSYLGVRKSMPRVAGLASTHNRIALHRRHADSYSNPKYGMPAYPNPFPGLPLIEHMDSPDSPRSPNTYLPIPVDSDGSTPSSWSTFQHHGVSRWPQGHSGVRAASLARMHHPDPLSFASDLTLTPNHPLTSPCPTAAWSIGSTGPGNRFLAAHQSDAFLQGDSEAICSDRVVHLSAYLNGSYYASSSSRPSDVLPSNGNNY